MLLLSTRWRCTAADFLGKRRSLERPGLVSQANLMHYVILLPQN